MLILHSRTRSPSPCAANPAGGFSAGEPPPRPHPSPGWGDRGQAGRGAWRCGAAGGGEGPGRQEEAGPAAVRRPGPVDCHWSARPAPSPWPRRPNPWAESGGGNRVAPLPASLQLFFSWGWGGREGEADVQTPRQPQPSSESIVTRGPAAPFSPRYLSASPLAARLAAARPRARRPRPLCCRSAARARESAFCPGSSLVLRVLSPKSQEV